MAINSDEREKRMTSYDMAVRAGAGNRAEYWQTWQTCAFEEYDLRISAVVMLLLCWQGGVCVRTYY